MDYRSEIQKIKRLVLSLRDTVADQQRVIKQQAARISILSNQIEELKTENHKLREALHKKNSSNSSTPPSKDENRPRKSQSLRKPTGRKNGGQKGHSGETLMIKGTPDEIVRHIPKYCNKCGRELAGDAIMVKKRQVIDIPQIVPVTTEHRAYSMTCSCGHCTADGFPAGVNAPVSYGENIETLIAYFSVRQYMPINRIQEFFAQVLSLKMSQGSICNKLKSFANKCLPVYRIIKDKVEKSNCVGADETGFVFNGKKGWMWVWQTPALTYIAASDNRGTKTITGTFANGFPVSVLVHDCWKPHFNIPAKNHQLCLAHLRRELNYFIELRKETWSYRFEKLLRKALKLQRKIIQNPNQDDQRYVQQINKDADHLLNIDMAKHKKVNTFKKRMTKYRDYLFLFLKDTNIPPDNNGSERAIRNVKVKQKVSGQFKTMDGANQFAIIRSVIDTCIKNNTDLFPTLSDFHNLIPE